MIAVPHDHGTSLLLDLRPRKLKDVVVREVRDQESHKLGRIIQPHDGTEAGVIAAAQTATDRMYATILFRENSRFLVHSGK